MLNIKELLGYKQLFSGSTVVNRADANDAVKTLLGHIELLNDRRFNELMTAKRSGYDDAKLELRTRVVGMVDQIDKVISLESTR